jgi:tRNA pseudouridine38-40 synthase
LLENALQIVVREHTRVDCAGRTDSGVHATGQVATFLSPVAPDPGKLTYSLNSLLPFDVSVQKSLNMPRNFHPRFSCIAREYEYVYHIGARSPFWRGRSWHRKKGFEIEEINQELAAICGHRDFIALTKTLYEGKGTVRYLDSAVLYRKEDPWTGHGDMIVLRVRANAFLHNMIRILAGTIVDRAAGKLSSITDAVLSGSRFKTGQTAPSEGLYFRHAFYVPGTAPGLKELALPDDHPLMRIHAGRMRSSREGDQENHAKE